MCFMSPFAHSRTETTNCSFNFVKMENPDIDQTSKAFAILSVSEGQRSPLQEILPSSERIRTPYSPRSSCSDQPSLHKSLRASGSESEQDRNHEDQICFNKLVKKAKYLAQDGKVREALELNKQALQIHYHEKLARRIAKMEEYLKNYGDEEDEEDGDGMVELGSGFCLYKDLCGKLYSHQKQGILWMWSLHKTNKGGILGDDMGLGKTIQIIAFLSGLFDMEKVKQALIVVPVSVMVNWEKEFNKWAPGISVNAYHGNSKRERERSLDRVRRRGGVLLTTYGMVVTSWEQLANSDGREFIWDYVVLDEGHKIKNPTKTTKGIHAVGARHRLILTGTPIQNNLKELWTLFDYVHQGSLLGTLRTFKMEFENPIIRARERDATSGEKRLGLEMAESLKKIIAPFFLRRTKAEVKNKEKQSGADDIHKSIKMPTMMYKNDFVVWLFLSETQLKIYQDFLQLDSVKELLMSSKSPLVALTVLKKICDHPRLLSLRACHQLGLHGHEMDEDELEHPSAYESAVTKVEQLDDKVLVGEAGKMGVLVALLNQLKEDGHRCLIFSQSKRMLDIIQKVLRNNGHKVIRLDGTVTSLTEREERVQKFQKDSSYTVFLLTTQIGGVGLTLTAADRVIIYDPSWNPATDAQAVDRAFRIGQMRNVVVYRLITCGTVEEKIYRRQIFKDSITRQTTGGTKDPYRYFTRQELRELFQLDEPRFSSTQQQLEEMHGLDRHRDPELDTHIAFLHSLDIFGISDHDLMFSQEAKPEEECEHEEIPEVDHHADEYIKHRVQKAKEIIERESSVPGTMEQRFSTAYQYPPTSVYAAPENRALMKGVGMMNQSVMSVRPTGQSQTGATQPAVVASRDTDVPVFKPSKTDTTRIMYNRILGQPSVFRVEIQKPQQPVLPAVNTAVNSRSSDSSDVVDLTEDDDEVEGQKPDVNRTDARTKEAEEEEENVVMPVIEKKVKQEQKPLKSQPTTDNTAKAQIQRLSIKEETAEEIQHPHKTESYMEMGINSQDQQQAEKVFGMEPETAPMNGIKQEMKPTELSEQDDSTFKSPPPPNHNQKRKPQSGGPTTPKAKPSQQQVIEEELIISPNAYTPLMQTRQKRHRVADSPAAMLDRSLAINLKDTPVRKNLMENSGGDVGEMLVDDSPAVSAKGSVSSASPGSTYQSQGKVDQLNNSADELQSFLNEEDQSLIEESFVSEDQDADGDSCPLAGKLGDVHDKEENDHKEDGCPAHDQDALEPASDDEDVVVKNRRRSVCHRVAVVESSEEEEQDEEDKENIHPSFSSKDGSSKDDEEAETDDCYDYKEGNENNNADYDESEEESECEEESADGEMTDDEADEDEGDENKENESVVIYDESMVEEEDVEEEDGDDVEEEEAEQKQVDIERLQQLLKEGKSLYKQKRYLEAKKYMEAALDILPDPQLLLMAEKIQSKIDAGL